MEPRLLLSAGYGILMGAEAVPTSGDLPLHVDFVPVTRDHHPVIRDEVIDLASEIADLKAEDANADASSLSLPGFATVNLAGEIKVMLRFESDQAGILSSLSAAGFRAGAFHQFNGSGSGWVSYADLEAVAEVMGVKEISFAIPPVTNVGDITSAGDGILNAGDLRSLLSIDGDGVKVGVISDGADHWDNVNDSGDLPGTITVDNIRSGSGDEGTAMMEIVYDLAPGVDLYFSGPADSDDMQDSIDWLIGQGCDIIVDDLSFFDQPMFEDGPVAEAALDAIGDDVVYVTSAGNYGDTHYQADYSDAGDGTHLFAAGQNYFPFVLGGYSSGYGFFQWSDEWGASSNNYDLYLYQYSGGNWVPVASSTTVQNGDDDPSEAISVTNSNAGSVLLAWVVDKASGSDRELELYTVGNVAAYQPALVVPGDSVFGHAAADGVIAVGAIGANDPYDPYYSDDPDHENIKPYSSQGPSTIYTNFSTQTSTERDGLDVAGIDGVWTKANDLGFFGEEDVPFNGTSAAAPHIAAIAALLKEIDPSLTPSEVVDLIGDNAVDLGTTGYDDVFGNGRADALAIISAATERPDLDAGDTGSSSSDDITMYDNHDNGSRLTFNVEGTTEGAELYLYADGDLVGYVAQADADDTDVMTDGSTDLTEGMEDITFTVVQVEPGKLPSPASTGLTVTIDTVAPTVSSFLREYQGGNWTVHPTTLDTLTVQFSEAVYDSSAAAGDALSLYNISTSTGITPTYTYSGDETDTLTWDYNELNLISSPGWYRVTISGTYLKDLAGNALGTDYVYGNSDPQNDMLVPIIGDADLVNGRHSDDLSILASHMGQGRLMDGRRFQLRRLDGRRRLHRF